MERFTRKTENGGGYTVDGDKIVRGDTGYSGEAVLQLAKFENVYEALVKSQNELSEELEKLRNEGKKNSVKFKELLGKKLINSSMISLFKTYELQ